MLKFAALVLVWKYNNACLNLLHWIMVWSDLLCNKKKQKQKNRTQQKEQEQYILSARGKTQQTSA